MLGPEGRVRNAETLLQWRGREAEGRLEPWMRRVLGLAWGQGDKAKMGYGSWKLNMFSALVWANVWSPQEVVT